LSTAYEQIDPNTILILSGNPNGKSSRSNYESVLNTLIPYPLFKSSGLRSHTFLSFGVFFSVRKKVSTKSLRSLSKISAESNPSKSV